MENITERIQLFHNLYRTLFGGMTGCLLISVILFFKLDMKNVIRYFLKRDVKKEIRKKQNREINNTGGMEEHTSVLRKTEDVTMVLPQEKLSFYCEYEILFIHTNEIIE